ncbi:MAG TPA: FkbM family methyltransferase [Bacteroidales bacterium]|nr:FkbM family methyltransferase [Bacteroidales bacterium]HOH23000.1 FkbM family methyltransferase [Bacteroidales bacterium]HPZ03621.1 FkbM family methyltransferase [Bacteroidales bacterium]HQB75222.1 FkbM family methyltransferase [Bacteroidales bacterium]
MNCKELIRKILIATGLDITKNIKYDRLTLQILKRVIKKDSNCIDIGAHKGEILSQIIRLAPEGIHFAFEPIPELFENLKINFPQVTLYPYALCNSKGESFFQWVKNAPAYSGLRKRTYAIQTPEIDQIKVETERLDQLIPENIRIDFIKIDVEGAEFEVLKGAERILRNNRPIIIFECGLGASEFYMTDPNEVFLFFQNLDLNIFTLEGFIKKQLPLSKELFLDMYQRNSEYYFVVSP